MISRYYPICCILFLCTISILLLSCTSEPESQPLPGRQPQASSDEWLITYGGSELDVANSIVAGSNGSIYITGPFAQGMDFDPGESVQSREYHDDNSNYYLACFSHEGELNWVRTWSAAMIYRPALAIDSEDNLYVLCEYSITGAVYKADGSVERSLENETNNLLWKVNPSGETEWMKTSDIGRDWHLLERWPGIPLYEVGCDNSGNVIAKCREEFVRKISSEGEDLWVIEAKGVLTALAVEPSGNVYSAGRFESYPGIDSVIIPAKDEEEPALVKLDENGHFLWARSIGIPMGDRFLWPYVELAIAGDGVCLAGPTHAGMGRCNSAFFTPIDIPFGYMMKFRSDGEQEWLRLLPGCWNLSLGADSCSEIYLAGLNARAMDFDGDPLTEETGESGWFLASFDAEGKYKGSRSWDDDRSMCLDLTIVGCEHIYLVGEYRNNSGFIEVISGDGSSRGGCDAFVYHMIASEL